MAGTSGTAAEGSVRRVRVTVRSAVLLVGGFVAVLAFRNAFVSAHRVLGWAAACAAVAVLVEPVATFLGRYIPRVAAVLLTFAVVGAGVGALVFGTVDDLDGEISRLQEIAPEATQRLEDRDDEIGEVARDLDLGTRVETFLDELDDRVGSGSSTLAENAPTLPVYFVNAILTIFLLLFGPGIIDGGIRQVRDEGRRRLVRTVLADAAQAARRTVVALFGQGLAIGVLAWGVAVLLELPAPIVLGLVAGVAAMLPDVGILLGVFPMLALTAGLESVRTAIFVFVGAAVLQAVEALVVRERVSRWGVAVGPAVIWIVALVGFTLHGVGMAVYGVVYAVFGLAVLERLPADRQRLRDEQAVSTPAAPG